MLLLSLLLAGVLGGQPEQTDRAEAERLARAGAYAQALERFRQIAAANPDDVDARVWIGKLHIWMGHPEVAEPVFRSVLDTAADRVDALIGLGAALTAIGRQADAIVALDRAEKLAPNDPDVLAAQGRAHSAAGHERLAEAYLARAAVLRAGDPGIAGALEAARHDTAHYASATFMHESYSVDVPDTRFGGVAINYRTNDRVRVTGRVEVQRKFRFDEARGGGGLMVRVLPRVTVRGEGVFGGDSEVFPRGDITGAFDVRHRSATWTGALRFFRFRGADYWVISPAVSVPLAGERAVLSASYSRSLTAFEGLEELVANNSGDLRLLVRAMPRLWVGGAYTRNVDRLEVLSPDRIGEFRANSGTAMGRLHLRSVTTLAVEYDYQRRDGGVRMNRLIASLVQQF